jgi:toxin ParE1/3/4
MDFKIVWTEPALDDLRDICSYLATKDLNSSERVGKDTLSHVNILEKFPFIGPKYPQGSSGRVCEILCRNYRIFYRVSEEQKNVEILTICHGSRGKPSTLV